MKGSPLRVRVSSPSEPILPGRGFYQLEEETLYVQVGPFSGKRRFFSYLESEQVRFDLDRQGRLIFIEVSTPRRQWRRQEVLMPPGIVEAADIRWLGFRERLPDPELVSTPDGTLLCLEFGGTDRAHNYYLAQSVIVQVGPRNLVSSVWITDIRDDLAGQEIAAFRKRLRGDSSPVEER